MSERTRLSYRDATPRCSAATATGHTGAAHITTAVTAEMARARRLENCGGWGRWEQERVVIMDVILLWALSP
jgi:hypothetical protein